MTWVTKGQPTREHNALCKGGCGYRLPLYTMAVLLPDQRNHHGRGMCKPCRDRDYHASVRAKKVAQVDVLI